VTTEQANVGVEVQQLVTQPVVQIRTTIRIAELPEAVGERVSAIADYLRRGEIATAGPPYVRYHTFGEGETDFELGVPVVKPVAGEGRVAAGELPAGPAISTWHTGPHGQLGEAYARIASWLRENGRGSGGPAWEVYPWLDVFNYAGPSTLDDPASWRTQLVQPIK
jgi:effector-binding domain-containing protein